MARPKILEERLIVRFPKGTFARFAAVANRPLAVTIREAALEWLGEQEYNAKLREREEEGGREMTIKASAPSSQKPT